MLFLCSIVDFLTDFRVFWRDVWQESSGIYVWGLIQKFLILSFSLNSLQRVLPRAHSTSTGVMPFCHSLGKYLKYQFQNIITIWFVFSFQLLGCSGFITHTLKCFSYEGQIHLSYAQSLHFLSRLLAPFSFCFSLTYSEERLFQSWLT